MDKYNKYGVYNMNKEYRISKKLRVHGNN